MSAVTLRLYSEADEAETIELWRRTWQIAYPQLDFDARVDWWLGRWRREIVPFSTITLAHQNGALAGFVTVDLKTHYLDQIVVAPESWAAGIGKILLDEAKRLSPEGLDLHVNDDNARAIQFYDKHGFVVSGKDKNPRSGAPIYKMKWRA